MQTIGKGRTDIGKIRSNNEDSFFVDDDLSLYVTCDGMGGHTSGEVAAATAIEAVARIVKDESATIHRVRTGRSSPKDLTRLATAAVQRACQEVYRLAAAQPKYAGMGCAMTVLLIASGKAAMAHVGDTRLYLCRSGEIHQLSVDHTLVQDLVKAGAITAAQVATHPYRNILNRAVGTQEAVKVDTLLFDVFPGDRLLLCSDGFSSYIDNPEWLAGALVGEAFEEIPGQLVDFANRSGGADNVSVVAIRVESDREGHPTSLGMRDTVEVKLDAMSSVFLFEDLSLAEMAQVMVACRSEGFRAGETVLDEGELCDRLLVTVEGRLGIFRGDLLIAEFQAGDHTGEDTLLRRRPSRSAVRALTDARLLSLDGQQFKQLVRSRPWLGITLLEKLGRRLSLEAERAGNPQGKPDTAVRTTYV